MIYKIVRLFINTSTADEKHYLLNRDNLRLAIHMQLSQKQKNFFRIYFGFLKSILNFKHFPKGDGTHS